MRNARYIKTVTSKGQITVPAAIRAKMKVRPGDKLGLTVEKSGILRIVRVGSPPPC